MKKIPLIIAFLALCVYVFNLSPSIFVGDSPELITAATTLGVAHPPGYPVFTIITNAAGRLFPYANPAYRANFANAFFVFISLLLVSRFLKIPTIVYFALSPLVFRSSLACEVFTLNILFAAVIICLLAGKTRKKTLAASFVFGLGLANHQTLILITPAVLFLLARRKLLNTKFIIYLTVLSLLGFSANFFLIVRAHAGAALNWGNPHNLAALMRVLSRRDYGTFALHGGQYSVSPLALLDWARIGFKFFGFIFLVAPVAYLLKIKKHNEFGHFLFISFLFTGPFFYLISGLSSANFLFLEAIMERFFLLPALCAVILFEEVFRGFGFRKLLGVLVTVAASAFVFAIPSHSLRNFFSLSDMTDSVLRDVPPWAELIVEKGAVGDDLIFALAYKKWAQGVRTPEIYTYYGAVFPAVYGKGLKKMSPLEKNAAKMRFYRRKSKKCFFAFSDSQIPLPGYKIRNLLWTDEAEKKEDVFWRLENSQNYRVRSLEVLFYYFKLLRNPDKDTARICAFEGRDIGWLLTNLGPVWIALGERDLAKECYRKSLRINPNLAETHNNLGVLLFYEKNYAASAGHFEEALKVEKDDVRFYNLGLALKKANKNTEARAAFENSLKLNPFNFRVFNEIGLIELNGGNFLTAAEFFQKGLAINPQDGNLKFNLALARGKMNEEK
ncbi:MAG: DUF2723 domain-containing protein [bacterium]